MTRREKISIVVTAALVAFGAGFIGLATWLGKQQRTSWTVAPDPPLTPIQRRFAEPLGMRRAILPRAANAAEPAASPEAARKIAAALAALEAAPPRFDEAERLLREALARAPDSIAARFDLGLLLAVTGRSADALPLLEPVAAEANADVDAVLLLGVALDAAGPDAAKRAADAEAAFTRAVALAPADADARFRLTRRLLQRGANREAIVHAEKLEKLAPGWAEAQRLFGEACLGVHDTGRAKQAFRAVLQLRPGDEHALSQLRRLEG